ncbi:MAG: patatin-like phospholipase family protein [Gemmatimonadales bacterium]
MTAPRRVVAIYGGGGAKAIGHLGAERALREAGLTPACYVGCSMGAVIAACLAAGLSPDEVKARADGLAGRKIAVADPLVALLGVSRPALLKPAPLRQAFEALVPVRSFTELKAPLTVAVTDLDSGELLFYGNGPGDRAAPLLDVLMATCALPLYFPPVTLDGRRCADGGLRAVVPFAAAGRLGADLVVAVDVGPGFDEPLREGPAGLPRMVQLNDDATGILMAQNTRDQLALWRATSGHPTLLYVRPQVERGATFNVARMTTYFDWGYSATRMVLTDAGFGAH